MRVVVRYEGGKAEAFDTEAFQGPGRGARQLMSDVTVTLGGGESAGVWLEADRYDAPDGQGASEVSAPDAQRRRGWRALLVSPEELPHVRSISLDGEPLWSRVGPDLADDSRMRFLADLLGGDGTSLSERVICAHDTLALAMPGLDEDEGGLDELAAMVGLTLASYETLANAFVAARERGM